MKKTLLGLCVLGLIVVFGYLASKESNFSINLGTSKTSPEDAPVTGALRGTKYTNSVYKFSVELPQDYQAREIYSRDSETVSRTILFEGKNGDGIQIVITPYDDIQNLTADMIKKDIPDMKISDVQTIDVGDNHKGVAFIGDNPEFGGASRDVWFVFKSNLYQISTYARLDSTLKLIFSTWQFF